MMDWALVLAADMASAVGADEKNRRMRNDIRKMRLLEGGDLVESERCCEIWSENTSASLRLLFRSDTQKGALLFG